MNVYVLYLSERAWDIESNPFGRAHGFAVVANSEQDARQLAAQVDEDNEELWINPIMSDCKLVNLNNPSSRGIILEDWWPDA
jgi:hypothetical protein